MITAEPVSLEEYLDAVYEPDCEWVDGKLSPRVEAAGAASFIKNRIRAFFTELEDACHVRSLLDQRIRVEHTARNQRYRVADVCVVKRPFTRQRVLTVAPLIAVEIARSGEYSGDLLGRLADLARIGTQHIWAVEPETPRVYVLSRTGLHDATGVKVPVPELNLLVNFRPFFHELD